MSQLNIVGVGKRVRIYIGESDTWHGRPLFLVILETLRAEGCAGATVLRGIASFGASSRIHTATILRLSEDLPVVTDWVDTPERIERVLPRVTALVESGLITVEDVQVVHYQHRPVADIGNRLRVREVMTRDVATVHPETPLRDAVELLVDKNYRALPVVDAQNRVVGIVSNDDLVERSGLRLRLDMLGTLTPESLAKELEALEEGKTVADVMTREVVTASPETTLAEAAHVMVTRQLKRLPVVDQQGVLLGMISRLDILRTLSEAFPQAPLEAPQVGGTVRDVMRTNVPTVRRGTLLAELLDAVVSTPLSSTLVLDDEGRVLGMVTDAELIRRLSPRDRPGLVRVLRGRLPVAHLPQQERRDLERAVGTTAEQLMIPDIPTVSPDSSVVEAIRIMLR